MKNNTAKALPNRLLGLRLTVSLAGLAIIALLIQMGQ